VASLGLVSPGAATDGVTLFFLPKYWRLFSHRPWWAMTFLAVVSWPLRVTPSRGGRWHPTKIYVWWLNLEKNTKFSYKIILVGCHTGRSAPPRTL